MKLSDALPCPFCGGKPEISVYRYGYAKNPYQIKHTCKGSDSQFHIHASNYFDKQDAIRAWNTRTDKES